MDKAEIDSIINSVRDDYKKTVPNGYTFIFPSPNEGERLLFAHCYNVSKAIQVASEIWKYTQTIEDNYHFVEEID